MPAILTTPKRTHLLDVSDHGYSPAGVQVLVTACGLHLLPATGGSTFPARGEHIAGPLLPAITCKGCRRTNFARDLDEAWNIKRARQRRAEVASAAAYVQSRFFPPLPREYGELAVQAIQAHEDGDPLRLILIDPELNPQPKGTVHGYVTAARLVTALRLQHMIDDDEE